MTVAGFMGRVFLFVSRRIGIDSTFFRKSAVAYKNNFYTATHSVTISYRYTFTADSEFYRLVPQTPEVFYRRHIGARIKRNKKNYAVTEPYKTFRK